LGIEFIKALLRFASALVLLTASPALADEPLAVTPSGATEAFFNIPLVETSDVLANSCVDFGWTTISSAETMVVCEVPLSVGASILSALAGPRYATPPREFIRFNLSGYNGLSRVQVSGWRELQTAFGQTQRTELGNENYHNVVMGFLVHLGAHYPPGTIFPNHASIDTDYEFISEPHKGMLLTGVKPEGPFYEAGLRDGDIVTRIARERIRSNNDVSDGLHKALRGDTFKVEYYRDGKESEAEVKTVFRDDIGPLPEALAKADPPEPAPSTTIIQQEFSVAEELERLADLMERGLLSAEEFQSEKEKPL